MDPRLLKSTLMMLAGKLRRRDHREDFDRSLPPIPGYPAELNQVWTNLIDNAVSAMDGHGTLGARRATMTGCWWRSLTPGPVSPATSTDLRAVLHHQARG